MDEKTSLLEQLRIDRGEEKRAPGQISPGGSDSGDGGHSDGLSRAERERMRRTMRRWRLMAVVCAIVVLGLGGFLGWQRFGNRLLGAASSSGGATSASGASADATGTAAGASEDTGAGSTAPGASGERSPASSGLGSGEASVLDASGYIV
ncbi:MAG TPA: hypothetical protein VGI35_07975, partial [Steroidobacteraceae bacterium]